MKHNWKSDLWIEVRLDRDGQWHASVPNRRDLDTCGGTMQSAVERLYVLYRNRKGSSGTATEQGAG